MKGAIVSGMNRLPVWGLSSLLAVVGCYSLEREPAESVPVARQVTDETSTTEPLRVPPRKLIQTVDLDLQLVNRLLSAVAESLKIENCPLKIMGAG